MQIAKMQPIVTDVTWSVCVEEWLVSAVMSMYTGAKTVVRTVYGNSKGFEVKSGYAPRVRIKSTVICDCHGGHI